MGDAVVTAIFTKFDPFSFLENGEGTDVPANPANAAKVLPQTDQGPSDTLAPLAALAEPNPASQNIAPAEWTDSLERRPTLVEHDARAGKRKNEPPYERMLAALCKRRPDLVEDNRWHQAIADSIAFVAQWGEQAAALGWTARDLFGLADVPDKPAPSFQRLSRYDQTGLVWLLQGRRVVTLTKDTAVIETANGTLSYRRYNKPALGPLGDSLDDMGARQ
jgi:hypothetical protein